MTGPDPVAATSPERVLREVFGLPSFRPGQRDIVQRLLAGRHLLAVMPTGAGKSLCYQTAALLLDGPTIVVSPLTALIDDQVAALRANGVDAAAIHSGRDREDNVADWRRFAAGQAKLCYMSPERLMSLRMMAALARRPPALFVVDEAHCISKWGISFRPEYEALSQLKDRFPAATLAAFTATADPATRRDIADKLFGGRGDCLISGFDRPNIRLHVASKTDGRRQLLDFVRARAGEAGIVYCLSRKNTEETAGMLRENGIHALAYHAGLDAGQRREHQEAFMAEPGVVMVATIAFGMGIDKPDIRFVFHANLPGSMEAYYQEIGRAGRDGAPATAQMIFGLDDIRLRRQFIAADDADAAHQRREHKRLDSLLAYCEATQCRRVALLAYFGETTAACGNCDVCLDPPEMVDGTGRARHLFAAIAETGSNFGAAHIIDLLRGAETRKIRDRRHDRLPSFGLGQNHSKADWQAFVRQAVAGGYLAIDVERFGALRLTEKGHAVRRGEAAFRHRALSRRPAVKKPTVATGKAATIAEPEDGLVDHLKAVRRDLAKARKVPAYIILNDATLLEICRVRPRDLDTLATISGIGPKKLETLGETILGAIAAYEAAVKPDSRPDSRKA